jgi:hypothetical protein
MLADFFLNTIYNTAVFFLSLFPTATISDQITASVATASTYIVSLNTFAPITTIISIIGIAMVLEGVFITIKLINWVIRKIPTIS